MLQEPAAPPHDFVAQLQNLGWVDLTALSVLFVFVVIGLWKGFVWQVSRVAILLVAWFLAGRYGAPLGDKLLHWTVSQEVTPQQQETALYIAYVLVFVGVLVVMSLLALLVQKLIKSAGMSFYDRLGGGIVGVGTGGCVVLFLVCLVYMFLPQSQVAHAAENSHSLRFSQRAVEWCGGTLPDGIRRVFKLPPLHPVGAGEGNVPNEPNDPQHPPANTNK